MKDGKPHFRIDLFARAQLLEDQSGQNLMDRKVLARVREQLDRALENDVRQLIQVMQNEKTDLISFGRQLYRRYPLEWERKYKHNWHEEFAKASFEVKASSVIENIGMISKNIAD